MFVGIDASAVHGKLGMSPGSVMLSNGATFAKFGGARGNGTSPRDVRMGGWLRLGNGAMFVESGRVIEVCEDFVRNGGVLDIQVGKLCSEFEGLQGYQE